LPPEAQKWIQREGFGGPRAGPEQQVGLPRDAGGRREEQLQLFAVEDTRASQVMLLEQLSQEGNGLQAWFCDAVA
jgi:hypothetical protein